MTYLFQNFNGALYLDYLFMLHFKLIHISKMGPDIYHGLKLKVSYNWTCPH